MSMVFVAFVKFVMLFGLWTHTPKLRYTPSSHILENIAAVKSKISVQSVIAKAQTKMYAHTFAQKYVLVMVKRLGSTMGVQNSRVIDQKLVQSVSKVRTELTSVKIEPG
mmetsp:Transcript_81824/g.144419  ORF Transcript_81824/g.144419 Transcript_81824/m.144419 type:complete len:109 (-) Transcript_81824:438-764(-)